MKPVETAPVLPVLVQGETAPQALAAAPSARQALFPSELSYDARLRAINALGSNLSPAEQTLLLGYLRESSPQDGLNPQQRNALKNDILNVLRTQTPAVRQLTGALIGIYENKNEDPVMRDYALQHLSEYRTMQTDPAKVAQIDASFWKAAAERSQPYAGTALLALTRLAEVESNPQTSFQRIGKMALALAADETAPLGSRITALSVAGRTGSRGAETIAFRALQKPDAAALHLAALAVLRQARLAGWTPLPDQKAALQRLAQNKRGRVQKSARTLLETL